MTGIDPQPIHKMLPDFARELGYTDDEQICRNRAEIIRQLNIIREKWYYDSAIPDIFDNQMFCMQVQKFREKCLSDCHCNDTYYGFNLPEEVEGVNDAWEDKEPLHLRSRFWESRFGRITNVGHRIAGLTLMPEMFVTQADLLEPDSLWVKVGKFDGNKEGEITYIAEEGKESKWRFTTKANGIAKLPENAYSITKVVLPDGLKEPLELYTASNRLLARYSGKDLVPCFRRVKLNGSSCPKLVRIQGNHRFRDVVYDCDVVEIGSRLILQYAARSIKYGDVGTDGDENNRGDLEYFKMVKAIKDRWAKVNGKMHEDISPLIRGSRSMYPKIGQIHKVRRQTR